MVAGSRPRSSQCRSITWDLWPKLSGVPHTFHSWACSAAMRMVRFSPPPPTSSGSGPTGLGFIGASSRR